MDLLDQYVSGSRTLPMVVHQDNKYSVGVAMYLAAIAVYLASNHFHFTPPLELPRNWIDYAVPFMPNTVWIYLSEYLFFSGIYIICRETINLNKYFYSFLSLQFVSAFIFCYWPTTYPRNLFPLPHDLNAVTHYVFSTLRQSDTPANCCPSLHVSSVYLSALMLRDESERVRKYFPFFFVWATAITVSTLTTKQHYLFDVVAGLLLAIAHFAFFHRYMGYRPIDRDFAQYRSKR